MTKTRPPIRGIICDMDGTVVDSGLDFGLIRREMGLPHGVPILESMQALSLDESRRCWDILQRHERDAAERAAPTPGIVSFLEQLAKHGLKRALFTRNNRWATTLTLNRCGLCFDVVVTREDGPVKPDPWAIHKICGIWNVLPEQVAVIGDFSHDIEAGRRAGARTVLFGGGRPRHKIPPAESADLYLDNFHTTDALLDALGLRGRY